MTTEEVDTDLALLLTKKKKKKKGAINFAKLEAEAATLAAQSVGQPSENNVADAPVSSNHVEQPVSSQQPSDLPQSPLATALPADVREEVQASLMQYSYELPLKKKRRRANVTFDGFESVVTLIDEVEDATRGGEGAELGVDDIDIDATDASSWSGTDRDYTYEELLERVFCIMKQKNPNMVDRKTKLVMKPPQVVRVGAKKTSFANFTDICKMLHRQPKHLLAFLLAELGTSGSVDGNNQLIIKGKFQQKQIETVLRRYIREYVTCHTCKSPQTFLQKDSRLFFLQCETCGSRCSVASIKSGFQAVTSHRAQLRAKQ